MKRRTFTKSLAALALTPALPATQAFAGTSAQFAPPQSLITWSRNFARLNGHCSPSILAEKLRINTHMATEIAANLMRNNVIGRPNAHGISKALRPLAA